MVTYYTTKLAIEHDPELDADQIARAIPEALAGAGVLFVRKPDTSDGDVRNQKIDPVSLCYTARVAGCVVSALALEG